MLHTLKKRLYFIVASYFAFWAKFVLRRWSPKTILITGSSGKTTTLHLVEAQLGDQAFYSHNANSVFGLAFQLLGLGTNVGSKADWLKRFLLAPTRAFKKPPSQSIYVVEADADRPHEGVFTSRFVKPEAVIWVSVFNTHSANFEAVVKNGQFPSIEQAIAYEFGNFAAAATKLVLANGDQPLLVKQLKRAREGVSVKAFSAKAISEYQVESDGVNFTIGSESIHLGSLQPKELGVSLQIVMSLMDYLELPFKPTFPGLVAPPGRSRVFKGQKSTTLIDSTYNTGLGATKALVDLFVSYPSSNKWLVIGDILEQGALEKSEHQELAKYLQPLKFDQLILLGRRNHQYAYPILATQSKTPVEAFDSPSEVLSYLKANLKGHEVILFKGAQGLEGVIEQLLLKPEDASELVRRSKYWTKRRQDWGLPS